MILLILSITLNFIFCLACIHLMFRVIQLQSIITVIIKDEKKHLTINIEELKNFLEEMKK